MPPENDNTASESTPSGPKSRVMPLQAAKANRVFQVVDISGGRELRHRLAEMGLSAGAMLMVESNAASGPFVISVKGTRLMLGRGMVHRIMVEPCH